MAEIMTDDELISSYKSGKQESFKDLVEKYTSPLYNFVARLTNKKIELVKSPYGENIEYSQ
jgi:DNA-directed RNA polymerase specialized sigma24 family protein